MAAKSLLKNEYVENCSLEDALKLSVKVILLSLKNMIVGFITMIIIWYRY